MANISDVGIANIALGLLGVKPITSFGDDSKAAQLLTNQYEALRDATLEDREWSFAIKRYIFDSAVEASPVFGYTYAFNLPADVLRVVAMPISDDDNAPGIDSWVVEGRQILCNEDYIRVRAIIRVETVTDFSPSFVQAFAYRIAHQLCVPLTENIKHFAELEKEYDKRISEAAATNGMQGKSQVLRSTNLTRVR